MQPGQRGTALLKNGKDEGGVKIELEVDGVKIRTFTGPPYEHTVNLADGVHELKAIAKDKSNNQADRSIIVGVNVAWDWVAPTPTPTPTPTTTPTTTPTSSPTSTP